MISIDIAGGKPCMQRKEQSSVTLGLQWVDCAQRCNEAAGSKMQGAPTSIFVLLTTLKPSMSATHNASKMRFSGFAWFIRS